MTSPPPSILRPHSLFLTLSQYHPVSLAIALPLSCPLAHVSASSRASERTCMRAFPFPPCTCSALTSSLTDQAMDLTLKTETVTLNQRDFETVTVTCVTLTYDARWMLTIMNGGGGILLLLLLLPGGHTNTVAMQALHTYYARPLYRKGGERMRERGRVYFTVYTTETKRPWCRGGREEEQERGRAGERAR